MAMILAVLQQHARIRLHGHDVFVSTVGGARLSGSASDTAVALAIASAHAGRPLGRDVAAIGELGLSGELRRVPDLPQRLAEAARLGFKSAIVPADSPASAGSSRIVDGMRVMEIDHIHAALRLVRLVEQPEATGPARCRTRRAGETGAGHASEIRRGRRLDSPTLTCDSSVPIR